MDVVVTGRHCTISPELKELVRDRIITVERLRDRVIRVEVEFSAADGTKNPSDAVEVQITLRSKGPVVRAEAKANDKTLAFEQAFDRLKAQLRKAADRRKTHRGLRAAIFTEEAASAPEPKKTEVEPEDDNGWAMVTGPSWCVRRSSRLFRSVWPRPWTRWSWWGTTSSFIRIPQRGNHPWSIGERPTTTVSFT